MPSAHVIVDGNASESRSPFTRPPLKTNLPTLTTLSLMNATIATPTTPSLTTSPTDTSIQSSPEGPRGRDAPTSCSPTVFQLPEASFAAVKSPKAHALSEALQQSKSPGLIRRISRGATNRMIRRRQSSTNVSREHSSGPVIMRRRSGSKSVVETDVGLASSGPASDDEDLDGHPLSLYTAAAHDTSMASRTGTPRRTSKVYLTKPHVPEQLRRGTDFVKVTKRKRKSMHFVLEEEPGRVSWNPSNSSKCFFVDDIQEIRTQEDARNYVEEMQMPGDILPLWFTIIYADQDRAKGRPLKTMHLIAPDRASFELWTSTLHELYRYRHGLMAGIAGSAQDNTTLQEHWRREMEKLSLTDVDEQFLDLTSIEALCKRLHVNCSRNSIRARFEEADLTKRSKLSFTEFRAFVRRLKERRDIKDIYRILTLGYPAGLTVAAFLEFLQDMQGIDTETAAPYWRKVFSECIIIANSASASSTLETHLNPLALMGFEAFATFLASEENSIVSQARPKVKLDRPLHSYLISSSHNTYLLGRQVAGISSTEAYVRALQNGCRCVEIDCWDGPDGRPIVSHGRTMTTSVLFADVITVIRRYAFEASEYPLTLSLEVHCNAAQQQAMVDIMIKELGALLVRKVLKPNTHTLPSPEELRHRILVKVKAAEAIPVQGLGIDVPSAASGRRQRSISSPFAGTSIPDASSFVTGQPLSRTPSMSPPNTPVWGARRTIVRKASTTTTTNPDSATDDSDWPLSPASAQIKARKPRSKIIKSLGEMGVYAQGVKFESFHSWESKTYNHIFSLAERTFENLCKDQDGKTAVEKHNQKYLMRVYPSGFRLKSTNPDPLAFWRRGVQMVALNWQTYDLAMQMNEAMFAKGSEATGYILKPEELQQPPPRTAELVADASLLPLASRQLVRFSIDVISAQQLLRQHRHAPDEIIHPYVELEVYLADDRMKGIIVGDGGRDVSPRDGLYGLGAPYKRRTDIHCYNGYNPAFNESFQFSLLTRYPSLVFVRWMVWNSPDGHHPGNSGSLEPLATYTAKLSSLELGYRHVPLRDRNGDTLLLSSLFCRIKRDTPMPIADNGEAMTEKMGKFKQLGHVLFKKPFSTDRKAPTPTPDGRSPRPRGSVDSEARRSTTDDDVNSLKLDA